MRAATSAANLGSRRDVVDRERLARQRREPAQADAQLQAGPDDLFGAEARGRAVHELTGRLVDHRDRAAGRAERGAAPHRRIG